MHMQWNAETDAKLFAGMIEECNIRLTQANYANLAKTMGCTPKAIIHRVSKIRKGGVATGDDDGPKATKVTATKKMASSTNKKISHTPSPEADDDEEVAGALTPPATNERPRRAMPKRDYAALAGEDGKESDDWLNKRVKIEVGEDIGEGLRQVNGEEGDGDED